MPARRRRVRAGRARRRRRPVRRPITCMLALRAAGSLTSRESARAARLAENPTALVPRAMLALADADDSARRVRPRVRVQFLGDRDFEILEASLAFAELGLFDEAASIVQAACVDARAAGPARASCRSTIWPGTRRSRGDAARPRSNGSPKPRPRRTRNACSPRGRRKSRSCSIAVQREPRRRPGPSAARLPAGQSRAAWTRRSPAWQKAAELNPEARASPGATSAWPPRPKNDLAKAEELYRKAIAARPDDQTLYRDLAEILIAAEPAARGDPACWRRCRSRACAGRRSR